MFILMNFRARFNLIKRVIKSLLRTVLLLRVITPIIVIYINDLL